MHHHHLNAIIRGEYPSFFMTNFIEVYDNALSSDQCQRVIDYFESSDEKQRGVVGQGDIVRVDLGRKDSTDLVLMFSYETELTKMIHDALYYSTKNIPKSTKTLVSYLLGHHRMTLIYKGIILVKDLKLFIAKTIQNMITLSWHGCST